MVDHPGRPVRPNSKQQRLVALAQHVLERGAVPIADLAEYFGVTKMTVYRDITELEGSGALFLRHGVAVASASSFTETAHNFRIALHADAKTAMCGAVRGRIRPGSTVFMDDSSTVIPLVDMLAEQAPITIITNSQAIAESAARHPELRLFVVGGAYRPTYNSYAGESTIAVLRTLTADFCVMSSTAISNGMLYHPIEENVAIKRTMIERSRRSFLLADASKFGHRATHELGRVNDFDLLVIAGSPDPTELAEVAIETVTV
ncbi:DeoR/GlpR family DNA-binding transcription regulator [Propionibacteriaceae bacterium G1746]|uniref:DeoR/GlpR family DNA-binding transcription regulator n=1 Tax=Aestuariimicrobium sp. G57 TaxID=3418485 RepID=UPI003C2496A4